MCGINYKKMIVSFIDILGFKDIIYREKDNPDFVNTILEILSLLQNLSGEHTDSSASEGNYFSFVFSDSMVRLTGINKDSEILEKLYNEINHLAYIQLNIINEHYLKNCHFLIRGAITIGDIYYNIEKARIFGPAFNLSYKLESEKSKYPRIIIDPEIYKDYLQGVKYNGKEFNIRIDSDKIPFIDYFTRAIKQDKCGKYLIENQVQIVKKKIVENELDKNKAALNNYYWLKNYHNFIVEKNNLGNNLIIE